MSQVRKTKNKQLDLLPKNYPDWDRNLNENFEKIDEAMGELNSKVGDNSTKLNGHISRNDNPHAVTATQVGLGNVTNESKSTMFANAALTGVPTAPTAPSKQNTNQIATTAHVLSTAQAVFNDNTANFTSHLANTNNPHSTTKEQVGLSNVTNESKSTMFANAALTGTPTAPTASATTNTTQVATTAFVKGQVVNNLTSTETTRPLSAEQGRLLNTNKANLASPALTGTPTAPTAGATTNSNQIATTAFVKSTDQAQTFRTSSSRGIAITYKMADANYSAKGKCSVAIGSCSEGSYTSTDGALAHGDFSIAIGSGDYEYGAWANGLGSIAIGSGGFLLQDYGATAYGKGGIAIGSIARADADDSVAIGSHVTAATGVIAAQALRSVAIGYDSYAMSTAVHSCTLVGGRTATPNQVVLGSTNHTPVASRALSVTSDERDKRNIQELSYNALEFINKVQPSQYQLDFRSDYFEYIGETIQENDIQSKDTEIKSRNSDQLIYKVAEVDGIEFILGDVESSDDIDETETPIFKLKGKKIYTQKQALKALRTNRTRQQVKSAPETDTELLEQVQQTKTAAFRRINVERDGSKCNTRYHNGVIAQQVKKVADEMGFDFAGFKDHSFNGGDDTCSIAYEEFIAPMIKSIQQLTQKVAYLEEKLEKVQC